MTDGWWRFVPADGASPSAGSIASAAATGQGALSRELREARALLGAARTASLLRMAKTAHDVSVGHPVRLLLVVAQQPQALQDALRVGFAIAGLAVDIRAIEGVADLREALVDPAAADFSNIDLALFFLPDPTGDSDALVSDLAEEVAARSLSPVAVVGFGCANDAPPDRTGVVALDLSVEGAVFDTRFAASFGAILTAAAADVLADAAAGLAARLKGTAPKLLVTDLDDTLWRGVLGEAGEGAPAPLLDRSYAESLAALRDRGIVLAIASRNDPAEVERHFASLDSSPLALVDFAARAIAWTDKASLVAEILDRLRLAPEHTVFVDDDPVNCAKVATRFPAMDVRRFTGKGFAAALRTDPLLAGAHGGEAAGRAEQYRRRAAVDRLRSETVDDAAFLQSLKTTVTIEPLGDALLPRATELAARVNQFRFTALRPNALQLGARSGSLDFMARLDDAFGAHGLVGLVLASAHGEDAVIDGFWLSCRSLERHIESAMLQALARRAEALGLSRLVGRIEILDRNAPARDCFARHGFLERGGEWHYALAANPGRLAAPLQGISLIDRLNGRNP